MFAVFLYLIEHYHVISQCPDALALAHRLAHVGFGEFEVRSAILWVEQLREPLIITHVHNATCGSQRIYHPIERAQLGNENIELLTQIEQNNSITSLQREYIIERAMMLPYTIHRSDLFKALLLAILWAHEHDIEDVLLHALIDEADDETLH